MINWAKVNQADRVDLSATPQGLRIYEKVSFTMTSAPGMKLALDAPGPAVSPNDLPRQSRCDPAIDQLSRFSDPLPGITH